MGRGRYSETPGGAEAVVSRVVLAPTGAVEALEPYVAEVLTAIKEILDVRAVLITDESCLSDMFDCFRDRSKDPELYARFSERLGISLDPGNEDDHYIVKIARRIKLERNG